LHLADALDFGRMQRVQLVLVVALLSAHALAALQPHHQIAHRLGVIGREVRPFALTLHFTHDDAQDRALALDHFFQTTKLLGVRVTTGTAAQFLALFGKRLLELDARALGGADHLVARDLQQAAVHGVRDGLLLDRCIDNHSLQLVGLDRLDGHRRFNGGLEQLLQTFFAKIVPKPPDLRGVARQPVLVVLHAAEELPKHVLAPARADLLVAEIKTVLEVQQAGHQADRQPGTPGVADAGAFQHQRGTEHVLAFEELTLASLALEFGRHRRFDLIPGKPPRQHRQWIVQFDHRVDAGAEKVGRLHLRIPQESNPQSFIPEGFGVPSLPRKVSIHAGWRDFAGPTQYAPIVEE
jgi:hypothetical protein